MYLNYLCCPAVLSEVIAGHHSASSFVHALCDGEVPPLMQNNALTQGVACRMGLNLFSMQLNEMTPGLESKLPPNDVRWRQDLRAIEKGDYAQARTSLAF